MSQTTISTEWIQQEEMAENMIPILGTLYRKNNVIVDLFGKGLIHQGIIDIIKIHKYAKKYLEQEVTMKDTLNVLIGISKLDLGACRIDLGKLTAKFLTTKDVELCDFLAKELSEAIGNNKQSLRDKPQDVVLFGFGRIGRLLARILIEKTGGGNKMLLRAIVVRPSKVSDDLDKRASLLRRDSIHGQFKGTINVDSKNKVMVVNGNSIQLIYATEPDKIDYTQYGIDDAILIDNTGVYRDRKALSLHLSSKGISKVILTAPGKGVPNIVAGVNYEAISKDENIFSCASCTTNAICPVLKCMDSKFGIEYVHVETVHSYTNDQNLLDNFHSKSRRGRAAPLNLVITETGAAESVGSVLPEFNGKVTGNAIRVPTPNVSLAILHMTLTKDTTVEEVNEYLRHLSMESRQIDFSASNEVVSSDFVGSKAAAVIDSCATICHKTKNGTNCVVYAYYDNENGYSCQVIRVLQKLAGIEHNRFPK